MYCAVRRCKAMMEIHQHVEELKQEADKLEQEWHKKKLCRMMAWREKTEKKIQHWQHRLENNKEAWYRHHCQTFSLDDLCRWSC